MTKGELYNELERLADLNIESNPIAASILCTLCGLLILDKEDMLAIYTAQINEFMINKNKSTTKQFNNEN
jgi:hypothetical protein